MVLQNDTHLIESALNSLNAVDALQDRLRHLVDVAIPGRHKENCLCFRDHNVMEQVCLCDCALAYGIFEAGYVMYYMRKIIVQQALCECNKNLSIDR